MDIDEASGNNNQFYNEKDISKYKSETPLIHSIRVRDFAKTGQIHPELLRLNEALFTEISRHKKRIEDFHLHIGNNQSAVNSKNHADISPKALKKKKRHSLNNNHAEEMEDRKDQPIQSHNTLSVPDDNNFYQSVFLTAALQLIEEKQLVDIKKTGKPDLPSDAILAGYLKKSKDTPIPMLCQKYVVLTRGLLTYYGGDAGTNSKKKTVPLDSHCCRCRPITSQRFHHKFVFEIVVFDHNETRIRRVWVAKSEEERTIWINAICKAMHNANGICISNEQHESDVCRFKKAQAIVRLAKSKAEYMNALRIANKNSGTVLPVEWVHQQTGSLNTPCGMDQVFKDIGRDTVKINGSLYNGSDGAGSVIGALTKCILDVSSNNQAKDGLTEAQALSFVRDILLACNRTQSGGDSYDTVHLLCQNQDLIVLCPSSAEAMPLEIKVCLVDIFKENPPHSNNFDTFDLETCDERVVSPTNHEKRKGRLSRTGVEDHERKGSHSFENNGGNLWNVWPTSHMRSKKQTSSHSLTPLPSQIQLQIELKATTSYRVCDANPQGTRNDTWAQIDATYSQIFTYASFYGAMAGHSQILLEVIEF